MMKSSLKPKFACRAKNPSNCRYHGAFQRLDKALEANDYAAYEIAKEEVLVAQKQAKVYRKVEGRANLPKGNVPIWNLKEAASAIRGITAAHRRCGAVAGFTTLRTPVRNAVA